VATEAVNQGVAPTMTSDELQQRIDETMWTPDYEIGSDSA